MDNFQAKLKPNEAVRLRDVEAEDLPIFFRHQDCPTANEMAGVAARSWPNFQQHWRENVLNQEGVLVKTILEGSAVAGNVVSFEGNGKRLIGYWLGEEFWGRNIASQAVFQFLPLVKERPVFAYVAKHNLASLRILKKSGFQILDESVIPGTEGTSPIEEYLLILTASS